MPSLHQLKRRVTETMVVENTLILPDTDAGVHHASELLRSGHLVALPTETVYGLAGDARNDAAVAAIYEAKGRPSFNPLIVHLPSVEAAHRYVVWNEMAEALAHAFWPGPMTLVLPLKEGHGLSPLVTAGLETVAIRLPAHDLARKVLTLSECPLAAPSANPSGKISPTTAGHVMAGLNGRIAAILDGGPCPVGVESTIIGVYDGTPRLLRPGGLSIEDAEGALGQPLAGAGAGITAPGQLVSHYAPGAKVRLNATTREGDELLLGFGEMDCDLNLSETGDVTEAATNLFPALHTLDALAPHGIAVAPIPNHGLGLAINDRLNRAAAPRD